MAERNGSSRRTGRLKTAEGLMEYAAPQIPIALAGRSDASTTSMARNPLAKEHPMATNAALRAAVGYLIVDSIAARLLPGAKREPVLAARGFTIEGRRVLLHMMTGAPRKMPRR
jgi:hypothetical protein